MLLMDYPYTIGEDFPDYSKEATCKLFCAYIYAHNKILISRIWSTSHNKIAILMCIKNFYYQRRYNRLFQKVIHKGG